jgi:hypothetical protein
MHRPTVDSTRVPMNSGAGFSDTTVIENRKKPNMAKFIK